MIDFLNCRKQRGTTLLLLLLTFAACAKKENPVAIPLEEKPVTLPVPSIDSIRPNATIYFDDTLRIYGKNFLLADFRAVIMIDTLDVLYLSDSLLLVVPVQRDTNSFIHLAFRDTTITAHERVWIHAPPSKKNLVENRTITRIAILHGKDSLWVITSVGSVSFNQSGIGLSLDTLGQSFSYDLDEISVHSGTQFVDSHMKILRIKHVPYNLQDRTYLHASLTGTCKQIGLEKCVNLDKVGYKDCKGQEPPWLGLYIDPSRDSTSVYTITFLLK